MYRDKLLIIGLVLAVLCICVGAVSAADIADDTATLAIDDSVDAMAMEDATTVDEADSDEAVEVKQVNDDVDENFETLEYSGTSVNADNWTALRDYSQKTDSNYVISLTGSEYDIGDDIQFKNNATIIGTPGSYITGSTNSIPFKESYLNNKYSVNFINVTFKDIACKMLIQAYTTGTTTIENCTFTNITVGSDHCSVVYNSYGNMNIIGSNFTNCSTSYGAITNYNWNPASVKMNVSDCRFEGNTASSEPGAINNCGIMNVTDSTFIGNHADLWAGAIHTHSNAQTRITGSEFTNNSAVWGGGALFSYSVLEVYDSTFTGNSGLGTNGGGAISGYNYGSTYDLTVSNCTFIQNEAVTGGAISVVNGGNLNVYDSTFINNTATTGQAITSATVVVDENSTGSPTTTIENNEFYNHTENTADTVYITGNNYACDYNTFNNSYQTPLTGIGNIYVNIPGSSSPSGLTKSRILKSAGPSDNLGDIETIVVTNDEELYAAFSQLRDKEGIIELAAGTYIWNIGDYLSYGGNITFIGQGSETILLPSTEYENLFILYLFDQADQKIGRNFKNLVIKDAFIEMSNDVSFDNVLFDNVVFNIGLYDYREHIMSNTFNPSEVTYYVTFKNCNFTNTQEVIMTEYSQGLADQVGAGEIAGYLYQSNFMSLADKTYYMFAYPHNDINIVNCSFSNIALDVLVFADTDYGYLNIENSVFKDCTYNTLAIAKASTTDYVNINNCWYDSNVALGFSNLGIFKTTQATDSYAVAQAVQNENVVYDGETLNDFVVKLVSVGAEGVESDFDATGYPSIPVTFTVDGAATESAFVDGIATLSVPLTTDQTVITATVGSKVLSFTLPEIPPVEVASPVIDDDNFADYFDANGNILHHIVITDGKIILGDLTNKDLVINQALDIVAKEGSKLVNCTITLSDDTSGSRINGLTFNNTNKNAIVVEQLSTKVTIESNKFDLTYDDTYTANAIAIMTKGLVDEVTIVGNDIKMTSAASYTYGLDLTYYLDWYTYADGNAKNFYIADNTIDIESTASSGMAEAMYLDTIIDSVIANNNIHIKTTNPGVANYAMQVADSWGFYNDPWAASSYNVTIKDNIIDLDAADLAYGISVISLWPYDEDYEDLIKDIVISGNDVTINTQTEGVGICAQSADVSITDNKVTLNAAHNPIQAYVDKYIGNESIGIFVFNYNEKDNMGYFVNNTATGNTITTNSRPIKAAKEDDRAQPLNISNNVFNIELNDDNYGLFFNEDGTPNDIFDPLGNYALIIGTLNNKDIVIGSGSNINITASDFEGIINGGTITIGDGAGSAGSIIISGLRITNNNKDAIVINDLTTNVTISQNNFDLSFDDSVYNAMAVVSYGFVDGVTVVDNVVTMNSAATNTYGFDFMYYLPGWTAYGITNAAHFYVANNTIDIESTASSGMAEAMYLDTLVDSVVEGNDIFVKTTNAAVANYGMQVADSWGFYNDPWAASPYNITISDNTIVLDAADLGYGISVISLWPMDEHYVDIIKDIKILGNDVTITTETEGVGICAHSSDVIINGNKVTLNANHNPILAYNDSYIGNKSCGIFVNNFNSMMGNYVNNTVTGNTIISNVEAIKVAKETEPVEPLVIEDNEIFTSYLIDDGSYATYFNADGTIKDDAPIAAGDILLIGDLTGKKLVIDTGLTIRGVPNKKLVNSTINLVQGADNSVIEDLNMEFTGDDTTGSIGIIYIKDVSNVTIQNNFIVVPNFVDKTGAKWGSSVYAIEVESGDLGCKDIFINNNEIFIEGTCRYLYGIDVFKTYGSENRNSNINIFENYVDLDGGSRMAEAIYVSESDDVIIDGNIIDSTSNGAAYGVATDQLTNAMITSNIIKVDAGTQAYGITATTAGTNTVIRANEIDAKGTGAVGIGINQQDGVIIEDNTVAIDGGDYSTITSSDTLGTANAAILVGEGNTNVEMSGNNITETSTVRFDTVIEASDITVTAAPSGEGKLEITLKTIGGTVLANQTIKVVFDNQVLELTTDANGVAVLPFALNKAGTYNADIFYLGDDDHRGADATAKVTINKIKSALTASGKTFLATAKTKKLTATLKDANGNALAKKTVTFTVNGKTYKATTNAKGVATVKLALKAAKTYKVTIKFAGDSVYAASTKSVKVKLNKEKTKITAPKKTFKRTAKTKKVVITLKNSKGKAIAKKKVTLIVNKKKYTVKTNKKGKATFKVKLTKKGTFKYTAKFAGDTQYKAVKKAGKIKIK